MAQRTVCLCEGKYIGIESIYTVVNGHQINIPEKLKELRAKSQNNELFCPCGCGANLILVAGDRNLREQHFRLKDGDYENVCNVVTEGRVSVDSKIVLKCWLDDKLNCDGIKMRVPICLVGDTERKYEFSFLSQAKKIAVSYCHERVNLSDEKFQILEENSQGIQIFYIVDIMNGGNYGQYPEALMKVQERQQYCLFLDVEDASYDEAKMYAAFYARNNDGLWEEVIFASGQLHDYNISDGGALLFKEELLTELLEKQVIAFEESMQAERAWREEEKKRRAEELKRIQVEEELKRLELQKRQEEADRERKKQQEETRQRREREEAERQAQIKLREEDFKRNMAENFSQQETQVRDAEGNRWVKCEYCGLIAKENEFTSYGGRNHINLGICKNCSSKVTIERNKPRVDEKSDKITYDATVCPECGGKLRKRTGRYGDFMGCSNYPKCSYTGRISKN